jgi:two-component system chemotaxis sensor kinase CheA
VDHGVEDIEVRRTQGKPPTATISLSTLIQGERLLLSIADDGGGIDAEALKASAAKKGIPIPKGDDAVQSLLFQDGLSTGQQVTEVSGRGVGLAAVRAACEQAGGQVEVDWVAGEGTRFSFWFPADIAEAAAHPSMAPAAE